jgi:YfiH family protein
VTSAGFVEIAPGLLQPDWDLPGGVGALLTTREGGQSRGVFASFNLGGHVGDDPLTVAANRARLRSFLPADPLWLNQVHGAAVADADVSEGVPEADAVLARSSRRVCAVQTADCLPVLLCDDDASVVAATHAGWRGLAAGVLENTVRGMGVPPQRVRAWLGPAIGPQAFEVGDEVRAAFVTDDPEAAAAFVACPVAGKWLADLFLLARRRLAAAGVDRISGGGVCTVSAPQRFYSYRRDGVTGRFASMVWLEPR